MGSPFRATQQKNQCVFTNFLTLHCQFTIELSAKVINKLADFQIFVRF